ncbi:MAG TPA: molybdopterin-dependent oxidoreductase, partial [Pseudomonadales bacterium]|nr:molybdopterin-dependent oxidoreductase [Pseudomonadales bacterium]
GTDKTNAIINCHLATGRIGKPGQAPFSITGQPNAMGGREVGGLANQLAAHMELNDATHRERVQRFWNAPVIAEKNGYKAVDLFDRMLEGKIKAIWIMATNPVVSLPNADKVKEALKKCDFVITSDCIGDTDTNAFAHIKLPACGWGEKDGTVTNSERRISRQRAFLAPAGDAKPDWWIVSEVAKRMGFTDAFNYQSAAAIFKEHAALSGFENDDMHGLRDFDISGFAEINDKEYDDLTPFQWPLNEKSPKGTVRLFEDKVFFTTNKRAQFIAVENKAPIHSTSKNFPLILNSGRIRDQWHTMTRTGLTPRLSSHISEPFLEIHPEDARAFALQENDIARISSRWGDAYARVQFSDKQKPGHVFMPIHWTGQLTTKSRVGATVNPAVDPISGQPELKHTPVNVSKFDGETHGFIIVKNEPALPAVDYACKIRIPGGWRLEIAHQNSFDVLQWLKSHLHDDCEERIEYIDLRANVFRIAVTANNALQAVAFTANQPIELNRTWLQSVLAQTELTDADRAALLSGKPADAAQDDGKTVCACFSVGQKKIERIIVEQNATTVDAIGKCCKAGTNCGSCVPEIKTILQNMANQSLGKTA